MAACSSTTRLLALLGVAASLLVTTPAQADESCHGVPEFSMSIARFRYAINALSGEDAGSDLDRELGMEFRSRALAFNFTSHRCELAHGLELVDIQAPDYGDPDSRVYHFLGYRLANLAPGWSTHVGVRGLTLAAGDLTFVTPTAGARIYRDRMSVTIDIELPGLFAASLGERARRLTDGLLLSAIGVVQTSRRTRLEARATWRNYRGFGLSHDVTLAAGIGLAPVARDTIRGLPGFLGIGVRKRVTESDENTRVLLLVEFNMGAVGPWPH